MMANNVMERVRRESPDSEKINAGLTLIFSEAARSHIQGGDLDKATLCVVEAVRCLSALSSGHSTLTEQGIDLVAATGGRGGVVRCQNVGQWRCRKAWLGGARRGGSTIGPVRSMQESP